VRLLGSPPFQRVDNRRFAVSSVCSSKGRDEKVAKRSSAPERRLNWRYLALTFAARRTQLPALTDRVPRVPENRANQRLRSKAEKETGGRNSHWTPPDQALLVHMANCHTAYLKETHETGLAGTLRERLTSRARLRQGSLSSRRTLRRRSALVVKRAGSARQLRVFKSISNIQGHVTCGVTADL